MKPYPSTLLLPASLLRDSVSIVGCLVGEVEGEGHVHRVL